MKIQIVVVALILLQGCVAQKFHTYKDWKTNENLNSNSIYFKLVEENQKEANNFLERFTKELSEELKSKSISAEFGFKEAEELDIIVEIMFLKPAYVYMGGNQKEIPLANRLKLTQLNKRSQKSKENMDTILSISVDKEEIGMNEAIINLANSIQMKMK